VNVHPAAAATAALKDTAHMDAERVENKRVRDYTVAAFKDMGFTGTASNANFVFLNLGRPAAEFRDACAKRSVFVARDFPPMEKTHARITIGTMDEMKRATAVFREVLALRTTTAAAQ
jgi:histidinol-phosphate aminotransferase